MFKRPIDVDLNPLGPIQWERGDKKKPTGHADELQHDKAQALVKYHGELDAEHPGSTEPVVELTAKSFDGVKKESTVLLVNFYAPWCPWSRRLDPVWKASALEVHAKYAKDLKNRVVLAEVDCTKHEQLCVGQHIQGYPSIRVYTKGSDHVAGGGTHDHASYHGDRTVEAISKFAAELLPTWKASDATHATTVATVRDPKESHGDSVKKIDGPGCSITGFVLVKKVPGTFAFTKSGGTLFTAPFVTIYCALHTSHVPCFISQLVTACPYIAQYTTDPFRVPIASTEP